MEVSRFSNAGSCKQDDPKPNQPASVTVDLRISAVIAHWVDQFCGLVECEPRHLIPGVRCGR
jgi:hypothetical protein